MKNFATYLNFNIQTMLLHGEPIAKSIHADTKKRVAALKKAGIEPKLAVILVGDDKPSQTYVKKKGEVAERVGIDFLLHTLPKQISKKEIIGVLKKIQKDPNVCGLIVQLPLPEPLYTHEVLNAIDPSVDVDCLTNENLGKLVMKTNIISPPTPMAVMSVLKNQKIRLAGKNVTIIGMGALVGKPLSIIMINERASVTTCNSATTDIKKKCLGADIIITGVGKSGIVTKDMITQDTIIIDTGVSFPDQKMSGDVDAKELDKKGCRVTPTPGGIGPITVAHLLRNVAILAENRLK